LKESCPDADIVCLSLAPTTSSAKIKNSNINKFNVALEKMAEECGVSYFDFTSILKDSNGYLMASRAGRDGIHWTKATYDDVVAILREY
jgi:lysophospholipase L1-like esterase